MGDGSLTQEEIDLLLQGADDLSGSSDAPKVQQQQAGGGQDMSPLERDAVADVIFQGLKSGTQGLSMIMSKDVSFGSPFAEVRAVGDLENEFSGSHISLEQNLSGGLSGRVGMFFGNNDARKLAAEIMGGNGADGDDSLDSAQIATIKEAMTPVLFSVSGQLSTRTGQAVNAPGVEVRNTGDGGFGLSDSHYLRIQLPFKVEGVIDSRTVFAIPVEMARTLYARLKAGPQQMHTGMAEGQAQSGPMPGQSPIQDVNFPQLSNAGMGPLTPNMDLLMDVQMTLTVELGRTKMYIKEILGLGEGSIIELDKLAGEPVDLLVNSKLIAKGEVVVIDENFGVRVTDIVSPVDRLKARKQTG